MGKQETRLSSRSVPSQNTDEYWLYATRKRGQYPTATTKSGKWLVFVPISQVDEVWVKIQDATEEGRLGDSAKVATAKPNRNASGSSKKVTCIYTYDWTDEEDVRRIRDDWASSLRSPTSRTMTPQQVDTPSTVTNVFPSTMNSLQVVSHAKETPAEQTPLKGVNIRVNLLLEEHSP